MVPISNPYSVLVNVVAPALLTNASTVLTLSTGNRLARAVDRAREMAPLLKSDYSADALKSPEMRELTSAAVRAEILVRALRWFYIAISGFAAATFLSALGQLAATYNLGPITHVLEIVGVLAGVIGVLGVVTGSASLVRETSIAVEDLRLQAEELRSTLKTRSQENTEAHPVE